MAPVMRALAQHLPMVHFWAPDGLQPCPAYPQGRQWFSFDGAVWNVDPQAKEHTLGLLKHSWHTFYERLDEAAQMMADQLTYGLNGFKGPVFVGGFSQGCGMAFHMALQKMVVAGAVGFSGFYILDQMPVYQPPMFWYHGDQDTMVHVSWMTQAQTQFFQHKIPLESHIQQGLEHTISPEGLMLAGQFIQRHLSQSSV